MSVEKASVSVDGNLQSSNVFEPGKSYVLYLSGVKGFTTFHPYGAPAEFVDIAGKFTIYDGQNNVVNNDDNIFSSYIGGIPVADAQYLQAKLSLPANIPSGSYRWEFIVTDKKNSNNAVKSIINFEIK